MELTQLQVKPVKALVRRPGLAMPSDFVPVVWQVVSGVQAAMVVLALLIAVLAV